MQPTQYLPPNATEVHVWEYGNDRARLLVDGLQHRVTVSVVDGDWQRSKVEVINNNPLDEDETSRVLPVPGRNGEQVSGQ